MDAELEMLYKEYDEILSIQKFIEEDLDYSLLDKHIEFLERLNVVENSLISTGMCGWRCASLIFRPIRIPVCR